MAARLSRLEDLVFNAVRLHRKDLMQRYGISAATLHRWLAAGRLPPPIRIGGPVWKLTDLEAAEASGALPRPFSA
jgi:predicted DNA-binding transcriptional regulator AlpA